MTLRIAGVIAVDEFAVEIDLTVDRGETVALVGPNGAGKSTVLRAISGLVALRAGRLEMDGVAWDDAALDLFVPPEDRSVGVVFQQYRLFDHMTARENVAFGLRARGVDRGTARRAADSILDALGVAAIAGQRPPTLSGGQAQRVALARAVVTEPAVLLLDEPLAALDASARGAVRRDLQRWLGGVDACRIVVTHDPVDAHALADRVVVLEHGRVTQAGTLADLAAAPRSSYVADLMGTNLLRGELVGGTIELPDGVELSVGAHEAGDGPVIVTIRPASIALHRSQPEGSPRNVWRTSIDGVDVSGDRVRVRLDEPLSLVVEVTTAGYAALEIGAHDAVWASVKASEVAVVADS